MGEDISKLKKNIAAIKKIMKGGDKSESIKAAKAIEPKSNLSKRGT